MQGPVAFLPCLSGPSNVRCASPTDLGVSRGLLLRGWFDKIPGLRPKRAALQSPAQEVLQAAHDHVMDCVRVLADKILAASIGGPRTARKVRAYVPASTVQVRIALATFCSGPSNVRCASPADVGVSRGLPLDW